MTATWTNWPTAILDTLRGGTVIPAHLLALDSRRELDVRRQRALSRYYIDAGVGGLAVGVHSTQFAIREAGLYENVLRLAAETAENWSKRPLVLIAGTRRADRAGSAGGRCRCRSRLSRRTIESGRDEGGQR